MNKYAVIDLETTGHSPKKGDRIMEIGLVIIENKQVTEKFSTFINPEKEIPSFITNLTGISQSDVEDAPLFSEVAVSIREMIKDSYIVAHNIPFDLGFLNYELEDSGYPLLNQPVLDTVELSRILLPQAPGFKLSQLSDYLRFSHDSPHRALSDALVTGDLLLHLIGKINTLPYETIVKLQELAQGLKSDIGSMLQEKADERAFHEVAFSAYDIYRGIVLKSQMSEEENTEEEEEGLSFGTLVDNLFSPSGKLAERMNQYEARNGQKEMAETVYEAFTSGKHALIEAETGTGKSLAYLIPALYEAVYKGEKILVSTHLTQLQSQLLDKEIPLLRRVLPFSFRTSLLKGKQHYISLQKFENELSTNQYDNYEITLTKAVLLIWLTETETGDIEEIQLPPSGNRFFSRISSDTEGAVDPKSPWFSRSFYQRAKARAQKADIVITNHSLLCTDLIHGFGLLPSFKKVIIDEAHHLENTAARHFGRKLDYSYIQYILTHTGASEEGELINRLFHRYEQVQKKVKEYEWDKYWKQTREETDDLFRLLFRYVMEKQKQGTVINDVGRFQYRFENDGNRGKDWATIQEMASRLTFFLRDLINILSRLTFSLEDNSIIKDSLDDIDELKEMMIKIQEIINGIEIMFLSNDEQMIRWAEIEAYGAKNAVYLYVEPIEVSTKLGETLFQKKDSVILTSATLTMQESFAFIRQRLGIPGDQVIEKKIASPYLYDQQVQLLVPNDFPAVQYRDNEEFIEAVCESIYSLAVVTNGRMLILFTSYEMLRKAHQILREILDTDEFMLIAQGISSGSRERLKKNFQAFDKAILLGTSSFWEGVDIPGDDLSCLMIVRLPFQPPNHPIYEAKAQRIKNSGKNPFMELSLPNAVIRFKQGFGRLIRSSTDRGIVFVCDERLITARYGKYFLNSIPQVPVFYDSTSELIRKAEDWL